MACDSKIHQGRVKSSFQRAGPGDPGGREARALRTECWHRVSLPPAVSTCHSSSPILSQESYSPPSCHRTLALLSFKINLELWFIMEIRNIN